MSEECTHDCSSCGANCASRGQAQSESLIEKPHAGSQIKKVIAVVSGKGGVGKSLVTSLMAVNMRRRDYQTAILDADITGPSIPKAFGIKEKATGDESGIYPVETKTGIKIMSLNVLLENDPDPVGWRGPIIAAPTAVQNIISMEKAISTRLRQSTRFHSLQNSRSIRNLRLPVIKAQSSSLKTALSIKLQKSLRNYESKRSSYKSFQRRL